MEHGIKASEIDLCDEIKIEKIKKLFLYGKIRLNKKFNAN